MDRGSTTHKGFHAGQQLCDAIQKVGTGDFIFVELAADGVVA